MSETRLTPEIELEGIAPDEAFSVLGNEIRIDIVRVLWQAEARYEYVDVSDAVETMSFSELRSRVDIEDNGKFNYHLSQLSPHFVRQEEEGYRLSAAGQRIARTVVAVSGTEDLDLERDLDLDCPLCGGRMTASYEDQWLRVRCSECDGLFGDESPEGTVYLSNYPPAGLRDRDIDEAVSTGLYRCMLDNAYLMHGVCRECASSVSSSVTVCESHEAGHDEPCPACGTDFEVWAELRCVTCGFAKRLPVELFVTGLTPTIGFLDDQGIDVLAPTFEELIDLLANRFETTTSEDPFRVSVAIHGDDATFGISLDREMNVVELDRGRSG